MIDGSADSMQQDIKYVKVRVITKEDVLRPRMRFVGGFTPGAGGADGLLEAVLSAFKSIGLSDTVVQENLLVSPQMENQPILERTVDYGLSLRLLLVTLCQLFGALVTDRIWQWKI